jgi:hypothetical protein
MTEQTYKQPTPDNPMVMKMTRFAPVVARLRAGQATPEDTMLLLKEPLLRILFQNKQLFNHTC